MKKKPTIAKLQAAAARARKRVSGYSVAKRASLLKAARRSIGKAGSPQRLVSRVCDCALCQRGRRFYKNTHMLPAEEKLWMRGFYDAVLDAECEESMRVAEPIHQSIKGERIACGEDILSVQSTPICNDVTCPECRAFVGKLVGCVFRPLAANNERSGDSPAAATGSTT